MGKCLVKESFFEKETREKLYTFFADKNINFKAMELSDAPYVSGNAIMASGSLFAQNLTKADLVKLENQVNALSQKVVQLETNLERVITENVNLVEQLNVKTVTSVTDNNGLQWDMVKVEPNNNKVVITLRISNNSGLVRDVRKANSSAYLSGGCYALDSNTNLSDNKYGIEISFNDVIESGAPINKTITISNVPTTCSFLSLIHCLVQQKPSK